jgi:hypothetical protein
MRLDPAPKALEAGEDLEVNAFNTMNKCEEPKRAFELMEISHSKPNPQNRPLHS